MPKKLANKLCRIGICDPSSEISTSQSATYKQAVEPGSQVDCRLYTAVLPSEVFARTGG